MEAADLPGEVTNPARPGCRPRLVHLQNRRHGDAAVNFHCDGCKLPGGAGPRYTSINHRSNVGVLHLHTHCALATPTLRHPLVRGTFELRHVAHTSIVCDACYGAVRGFHYHCSTRTNRGEYPDLHPCCAKLPVSMTWHDITFELRTEVSHRCTSCREMEGYYRPWCYRSTNPNQRVYLHVKCILEAEEDGDDERVTARLLHRAGRNAKLERRLLTTLALLVRVVVRLFLGDPTAIFMEGANAAIMAMAP